MPGIWRGLLGSSDVAGWKFKRCDPCSGDKCYEKCEESRSISLAPKGTIQTLLGIVPESGHVLRRPCRATVDQAGHHDGRDTGSEYAPGQSLH